MEENLLAGALGKAVIRLWECNVGSARGLTAAPCATSGNNRVFVLNDGDRKAVAKCYAESPPGSRDRLDAEWRFLSYACALGIRSVPRPLARDDGARLAFHEFCVGTRPDPTGIGWTEVAAATALFQQLNAPNRRAAAACLPDAAEACFSATTHIALVDRRIERLVGLSSGTSPGHDTGTELDAQAGKLAAAMAAFWARLRTELPTRLAQAGIDPEADLAPEARCVSPSDFGFHNALVGPDGIIRFVDFEYAGWDDPAKMICDFFLQPAAPVPPVHRERFIAATIGDWPDSRSLALRARLLHPLFALKWCCIMLNPFVPEAAHRGRFANPALSDEDRKRDRLAIATAAFHNLCGD